MTLGTGDKILGDESGQAMVEYLIVGLVLITMIVALALLGQVLDRGLFVEHAARSASHSLGANPIGAIGDVLLY
ncbi:MAG: hypothetical protein LBH64_05110 [Coriobacteriales bacterium]|jgi:Flp pilus assembly pilin Flp|nr:hypothetical protein [Coriobacteriales bacterium]